MKRKFSMFLAMLTLASSLAACAQDSASDGTDTSGANSPADTTAVTEPAETNRADAKDNIPEGFTLNGKTVGIYANAGTRRKMDVDGGGEEVGDVVYDAVYLRTRSVADRLDVNIEVTELEANYKDYGSSVEQNILAGDDVWQIVSISSNASIGMGRNYLFQDLQDNKYIDFEQPWWWTDAMMELTLDNKGIKYLVGDIVLSSYYYCGAMFFNKVLLEANGEDSEALYQTVIDREWTYDKLGEMAQRMYKDVDGDGVISDPDVLGFLLDTREYVKFLEYGANVSRYHRDDNGYPVMEYDQERAEAAVTKGMKLMLETPGVKYLAAKARDYSYFTEGRLAFYGGLLGDTMNENIRAMEDEYGVIPYPMLDDTQEDYTNFIHNSSAFMTVPITCKNADEIGAVLEAMCSESYRSVVEPFFEVALKSKYSHDSQSGQCIDIIRQVSVKSFLAEYTKVGGGFLISDQIAKGTNNFASSYASTQPSTNQKIQDLIKQYQDMTSAQG